MNYFIKGNSYSFPDSLDDILLSKHMEWSMWYGASLAARGKEIDEFSGNRYYIERIQMAISFYAGIELDEIKSCDFYEVAMPYGLTGIKECVEYDYIPIQNPYIFMDEEYRAYTPLEGLSLPINYEEFNAILKIKGVFERMLEGDYQDAPIFFAAYLRKDGEVFHPALIDPASPRINQMKALPMSIALPTMQHIHINQSEFDEALNTFIA